MAKKRNVVKRVRGNAVLLLSGITGAGWILAAYTVLANDTAAQQKAMIAIAQEYLEDKLYVRAVSQYTRALSTYQTENNLQYEAQLLEIYKEAGMLEEYYDLIQSRMNAGRASLEEYMTLAQAYIESGAAYKAISILQQGLEIYQDENLTTLYESICYEYSSTGTIFTQIDMPSEDWYIPAFDGEHWGYIGSNGRTLLEFTYEEATCFSGKYAVVKLKGVYTLIDQNGYWNAVDKNDLDRVTALCGTRIVGVKDGKYAIYTNTFERLGDETYDNAYLNDNGLILAQRDGKWAILDSRLQPVTDFRFTSVAVNSRGQVYSGRYAVAADEKGFFLMDQAGEPCFEERFADARGIEEGLFAVADSQGRWGFANEKAELVVEYRYEDAYSFSNRLAAVKYAGKWGYINRYGTMVIEAQFGQAFPFLEGMSLAADDLGNYKILALKYFDLF